MGFSWATHPEFLEFFLQYIEDHKGADGSPQEYRNMLAGAKQKFGAPACSELRGDTITNKLSKIVSINKINATHTLRQLWSQGVRILKLENLNCNINFNDDSAANTQAKSSPKRGLPDSEDVENVPSKRLKLNHREASKKRSLKNMDDDGTEDDAESQPLKKRQKTQQPENIRKRLILKGRPSKTIDKARKRAPTKRKEEEIVSLNGSDEESNISGEPEDLDVDADADPLAMHTEDLVTKHRRSVHGKGIENPYTAIVDSSNEDDEEVQEGDNAGNDVSRKKTVRPATRHRASMNMLKPKETCQITRPLDRDAENERPGEESNKDDIPQQSVKASPPLPVEQLLQGLSPIERYFDQRRAPIDHTDGAVPREAPDDAAPYSLALIQKTMFKLAHWISETVEVELKARDRDGNQSFNLDVDIFDQDGLSILKKIFGNGYTARRLKHHLNDAQSQRRLTLSVFLEAFIGAAVSQNALERAPHDKIDKQSVGYDFYQQALKSIRSQGMNQYGFDHRRNFFSEKLTNNVLRNHIIDCVLPKIEAKAGDLADDLRSQIVLAFMSDSDNWSCKTAWIHASGPRSEKSDEEFPSGAHPAHKHDSSGSPRDSLWENLKEIFLLALTARAEWEAWGEALYKFEFREFRGLYDHELDRDNEGTKPDTAKSHNIFVSVLPRIWRSLRDNRNSPFKEYRCATRGIVYLIDP